MMDWLAELNDTIEMESWFEIQSSDAKELRDFILEKDAEIERLREALKFYAEEENWHIPYLQGSRIVVDGGYKARSALQQKETE